MPHAEENVCLLFACTSVTCYPSNASVLKQNMHLNKRDACAVSVYHLTRLNYLYSPVRRALHINQFHQSLWWIFSEVDRSCWAFCRLVCAQWIVKISHINNIWLPMFASKGTEKCALQTVIAFDPKGCGRFSIYCHTYMEPQITQPSCCDYFMAHCAARACKLSVWRSLFSVTWYIFLLVLCLFFLFFLILASTPNTF